MAEEQVSASTPAESALAPAILRGLGDRSYDKRKNAALEIEDLIKQLDFNNESDRICAIISLLGQDFATSTNANHRKGGLIGLAAAAIGLMGVGAVRCFFWISNCVVFVLHNIGSRQNSFSIVLLSSVQIQLIDDALYGIYGRD